ncbi:hypothetical protein BSKO_12220 [Bryopsis sp. KO-2023]|nr:hypothetical protein BSKO_12220 [Bryopsis sp. KO-2023]
MLGSRHCWIDRPFVGRTLGRSSVLPVCKTGGFGGGKKKASTDPSSRKKVKRAKSKGKSTMRMGKPAMGGAPLTAEEEEDRRKEMEKRMSAAEALGAGGATPDKEFAQRLSTLKKDGREKAALMEKMKDPRRRGEYLNSDSIMDEKPFGGTPSSETNDESLGPNKGAIVTLSIVLLAAFLWSSVAN